MLKLAFWYLGTFIVKSYSNNRKIFCRNASCVTYETLKDKLIAELFLKNKIIEATQGVRQLSPLSLSLSPRKLSNLTTYELCYSSILHLSLYFSFHTLLFHYSLLHSRSHYVLPLPLPITLSLSLSLSLFSSLSVHYHRVLFINFITQVCKTT